MAINILQSPTGPAYSYNDLVYVVSSDLVGPTILPADLPVEHSFVVDIYFGTDRIGRYRKQANPNGDCVFELASVLNNELEYDLGILGTTGDALSGDSAKSFSVRFGEEFQVADVLQVHTGQTFDPLGDPAIIASGIFVIKGFRSFNEGNFTGLQIRNGILSNVIGTRLHRNDTLTISDLQSGPRQIVHHVVTIPSTGDNLNISVDGTTFSFTIYDEQSFLGESRFAWFNRSGGVDYFTFDQLETVNNSVDKTDRNVSIVDYNGSSSSNREVANANVFKGGSSTYKIDFETSITKNSRWLTTEESEGVAGMFDSPAVYLQRGSEWLPVLVLNSAYDSQTVSRDTTNFQYQLEYRFRNDKRGF